MTPLDVVQQTARPILEFGRAWMADPGTWERAQGLGFTTPFGFWVNGRAGAMGEVSPDVAAAAIGFMAPGQVRDEWTGRPDGLSAAGAAAAFAEAAADWARGAVGDHPSEAVDELNELSAVVIEAAQPSIGALFAGWRDLPLPDDGIGALTIRLNVLRELRGGAHLSAVHAAGIGPLGSIMSTDDPIRGGSNWARTFGWPEPHPDGDPEARARAEELTDTICVSAYSALDADQGARFVDRMVALRAAID